MIKLDKYRRGIKLCMAFLFWGIICFFKGFASDSLQISLLTCSSGEEVYATFGHSALRVLNKETGSDKVYNFGMFNFDTPNFQVKFMQGKLQYQLGIQSFDQFLKIYEGENRLVVEQILNLTNAQKTSILKQLNFLYLPKNRYYQYEFCKKNCTTALRDLIFSAITTDTSYQTKSIHKSYRMLFNECLTEKPWLCFGMNLILGSVVDKDINVYESMFLPEYLRNDMNKVAQNGYKLVCEEKALNTINKKNTSWYLKIFTPFILCLILLLLSLLFCKSEYLMSTIFAFAGLLGITLLIISIFTQHIELKNNFNALWLNPLYIVSAILAIQKNLSKQRVLAYCNLIFSMVAVVLWITGVQSFQWAFILLMLLLNIYNLRIIMIKNKLNAL